MTKFEIVQHYFPVAILCLGALAVLICGLGIRTQVVNLKVSRQLRRT